MQKNGCESCKFVSVSLVAKYSQHSSKDTNTAMWPSSEIKMTIINRASSFQSMPKLSGYSDLLYAVSFLWSDLRFSLNQR